MHWCCPSACLSLHLFVLLLLLGGSLGHVVAAYSFFTAVSLLPCSYIQPNTVNTFSARDMVTCPMHIASSVHCRPCRNTCCWSNTLYPCFVLPPLHSFRPGAECVQINYQNPKKNSSTSGGLPSPSSPLDPLLIFPVSAFEVLQCCVQIWQTYDITKSTVYVLQSA